MSSYISAWWANVILTVVGQFIFKVPEITMGCKFRIVAYIREVVRQFSQIGGVFWTLYIVILTENGRLKDVCSLDYLEEEVPKLARV